MQINIIVATFYEGKKELESEEGTKGPLTF